MYKFLASSCSRRQLILVDKYFPERWTGKKFNEVCTIKCAPVPNVSLNCPVRACAARGKVISRVCPVSINLQFFWNQSFISQNTHFQSSISTQIGFSSNLMASGTA